MWIFGKVVKLQFIVMAVLLSFLLVSCTAKRQGIEPDIKLTHKINLLSRSFVPASGIDSTLINELKTPENITINCLIQFHKRLSLKDHEFLFKSGIRLIEPVSATSYVASIASGTGLNIGRLGEIVRWASKLSPDDKLKRNLAKRQFYDWAVDDQTQKIKLLVKFFPNISKEQITKDFASLGLKAKRYGADNSYAVETVESDINRLTRLESVKLIQQGPVPFLPLNEEGRRIANTDQAQFGDFSGLQPAYNRVSGSGVEIGICDNGVDQNHNDFDQVNVNGTAGVSRVYNQRTGQPDWHGTHVASIAGGSGFNSANNGFPAFLLRGHAPRASLGDYPQFGGDADLFHDAFVNDGTDVTNHSYVQSMTVYDAEAVSLDMIVRGDATNTAGNAIPARPQVWAAGNNGTGALYGNEEGYYAVFTSAKNTISVGSVDTFDEQLSDFSSLGPTFDGRIKPDVVAPGCRNSLLNPNDGIMAANDKTQGYTGMCGTSMAAPVVTGIIALMMEQYQTSYGTFPDLLPSTYKAILVHTAHDVIKAESNAARDFANPDTDATLLYHAGPDYATGFGLVDADDARTMITKSNHWRESEINSVGANLRYCISVPEGSKELKVVISWDDEPGSDITAETVAKLVNDLDLVLVDPSGNEHLPWTLDPLPLTATPGDGAQDPIAPGDVNPAYRGEDHLNNVEMVSLCYPAAGTWTAKVSATSLPTGNIQPFSLVSSHRILPYCIIFPPIKICDLYPWICDVIYIPDIVIDTLWWIDPVIPVVPLDDICKYVINCPGCDGSGWSYCPGWEFSIDRLPRDARVIIYNQKGRIIVDDTTMGSKRILKLDRVTPGDHFFMSITDPKGKPFGKKIGIKLDIRSL